MICPETYELGFQNHLEDFDIAFLWLSLSFQHWSFIYSGFMICFSSFIFNILSDLTHSTFKIGLVWFTNLLCITCSLYYIYKYG